MNPKNAPLLLAASLMLLAVSLPVDAQFGAIDQDAEDKPTLVILGTYHMAPTTSNVINIDVDDVTTADRQAQMQELVERLERFDATKVALECDFEDTEAVSERYRAYLAGEQGLGRSEAHQIGFRLARSSGLDRVHCIDWSVFPDDPLVNYETYARRHPELQRYLEDMYAGNRGEAERKAENIASRTIIENLIAMNRPESMEADHRRYFRILRIGRGDEYAGANYLAWWYERNLKILANLLRITESQDDRIFVVYGAGHAMLLNQLARESGFYAVESPLAYLRD